MTSRSLKSSNMKWLVGLAALDVLVILLFVFPEVIEQSELKRLVVVRGLITSVLPVIVLMLSGLISPDTKARLVFWRLKDPLPGSAAFTKYGPGDPRVDMEGLKKNTGDLPTDPSEQNKKWYRLYRLADKDAAVEVAHRMYLLFRDMCAMSLPLLALVPVGLYSLVGASTTATLATALLFLAQFVAARENAKNHGIRFIGNVLAIHSIKKIPASKAGSSST